VNPEFMPLHRTFRHALSEFSVRQNSSALVSANIGAWLVIWSWPNFLFPFSILILSPDDEKALD
jgi:hypothetical protein